MPVPVRTIPLGACFGDERKIGTAATLFHNGTAELHATVTKTERTVRDKQDPPTVVGVDVIDFPESTFDRHRSFQVSFARNYGSYCFLVRDARDVDGAYRGDMGIHDGSGDAL